MIQPWTVPRGKPPPRASLPPPPLIRRPCPRSRAEGETYGEGRAGPVPRPLLRRPHDADAERAKQISATHKMMKNIL